MAQPDSRNPAIQSTASDESSNASPGLSPGFQDSIQASPAANVSNSPLMSAETLPPAILLMIEKEVGRRAEELRRAGYLWKDKVYLLTRIVYTWG